VSDEKISFEELVSELRKLAPGRVTTACYSDMKFLHDIGSTDWSFAGMLCFQKMIDDHGTEEEKLRLENLRVGYRRRETKS
jgi:hypothetical protein